MKLRKILAVLLLASMIASSAAIPASAAREDYPDLPVITAPDTVIRGDYYIGTDLIFTNQNVVIDGSIMTSANITVKDGSLTVTGDVLTSGGSITAVNSTIRVDGDLTVNGVSLRTRYEQETPGQIEVGGNMIVSSGRVDVSECDLNVAGCLTQTTTLTCSNGTLSVGGRWMQKGGGLVIGNANVTAGGDFIIGTPVEGSTEYDNSDGYLDMSGENGYFTVCGNFITHSNYGTNFNVLTAGTLELKGDFTQMTGQNGGGVVNNFNATGTHKVKLTGTNSQKITFANPESSGFNMLLSSNVPDAVLNEVSIKKLEGDSIIGSFTQYSCDRQPLDLNGYTLTVKNDVKEFGHIRLNKGTLAVDGTYLHTAGNLYIEDGKMNVAGDYRIGTAVTDIEGVVSYTNANAALDMEDEKGYMTVGGDFITHSNQRTNFNVLTAGTLEIKGDFTQLTGQNGGGVVNNFYSTDKHRIIFSGEETQTVKFADPLYSCFHMLAATLNTDVNIVSGNIHRLEADCQLSSFVQYGSLDLNGHTLTVTGNVTQYGDIHLNGGSLIVKGNYLQPGGVLYIEDGTMRVERDYRIQTAVTDNAGDVTYTNSSGALSMEDDRGYMVVDGDFITHSNQRTNFNVLTAGTLELKGDFTQLTGQNGGGVVNNFNATGTHKVKLTGTNSQKITFADPESSGFNILLSSNVPDAVLNKVSIKKLEGNSIIGSFTQYSCDRQPFDLNGYSLTVTDGMNEFGDIQLNKGTLNVGGDYLHTQKILNIQNGKMTVEGNYRIGTDTLTKDEQGKPIYSSAYAALDMEDDNGYMTVCGNFITHSNYRVDKNILTAGTLELKGDFTQLAGQNGGGVVNNFNATGTHKLKLTGANLQTITFENPETSGFNILSASNAPNAVLNKVSIHKLEGNSKINSFSQYSCDRQPLDLNGYSLTVTDGMNEFGDIQLNKGTLQVGGDYLQTQGKLYIADGTMKVDGDYRIGTDTLTKDERGKTVYSNAYAALDMEDENGYMLVGGDFITHSNYGTNFNILTAGILELKGDFTQITGQNGGGIGNNFYGNGMHITILSGEGEQTVSFANSGSSRFNRLVVQNQSRLPEYVPEININALAKEMIVCSGFTNISEIAAEAVYYGESVRIEGAATGQSGDCEYSYYYRRKGDIEWTQIGERTSSRACVFTPPAWDVTYEVAVNVDDKATGAMLSRQFEVVVTLPQLINTSTISSTQVNVGESVKITGSVSGGAAPYSYAYYYKRSSNTKWNAIKASVASFTPTAAAQYDVKAVVSDAAGNTAEKVFTVTSVEVEKELVNNSTVASAAINLGEKITVNGIAEGGTAPYSYAYYYKRSTNTSWKTLGTEFGTAVSASFTPTAAAAFDVKVVVKDSKGQTAEKIMQVTVKEQNTLENGAVINSEIVGVGDKVRIAANAGGGTGPYTYAYYYKRHVNTKWNVLGTEFGTNSSVTFTPTAEAVYDVKVVVKDSVGATAEKYFTVEAKKDMELTNVSVLSRVSVKLGGSIPILGKAVGGKAPYSYAFYFKRSTNTKWKALGTEFGTETSARLKPTAAGTFDIRVIVKDSTGKTSTKQMTATAK